ncbi:hypothetical protein MUK42_33015 [Musa troglodytarum]|uniref:Uncharacterized protein n=1 Tax=Musa troglodytarum TaxID=320322 RepID=A0A9E7JQB2_9LILI|nr:hypothetical protein MUK42_33015 [Musa troglodytarum]
MMLSEGRIMKFYTLSCTHWMPKGSAAQVALRAMYSDTFVPLCFPGWLLKLQSFHREKEMVAAAVNMFLACKKQKEEVRICMHTEKESLHNASPC